MSNEQYFEDLKSQEVSWVKIELNKQYNNLKLNLFNDELRREILSKITFLEYELSKRGGKLYED